jgi:hypothetical protein
VVPEVFVAVAAAAETVTVEGRVGPKPQGSQEEEQNPYDEGD